MSPVERAEKLRGSQPIEELGTRGIERVARNPDCLRLKALTIVGVSPAKAAQDILNRDDAEAQSPFALVLHQKFERHVLQNGAANLFALYVDQQHLSPGESRIVSVEELAPGDGPTQRFRRESETRRLIALKLARDPGAPNLILKPRLLIDYGGVPHAIEPDYLVARDDEPFYRVGVLKSYADRGGKTDPADLRAACRQAAVGVAALRQLVAGFGAASALAAAQCDLILKVTGFFLSTLQRMAIIGEVDSIERALADAPASLDEIEALVPAWASLSDPAALVAIPSRYHSNCREHCALWTHCREQAIATSNPALLGEHASEYLAPAGSIARAIELMKSAPGTTPRTEAEAVVQAEIARAYRTLSEVANG
jgi:hypothetical protein